MLNIKKLISGFLLLLIIVSGAFWIYKEFSQRYPQKEFISQTRASDTLLTQKIEPSKIDYEGEKATSQEPLPGAISSKIIVYYFYGTHRCPSCILVERLSQEVVEEYFVNEIKEGILEYKALNVERPENHHYIKEYALYTRSLIVALYKNGRQEKWKNLIGVWYYLRNKEMFYQYVKSEIEAFLEEARK